MIVAFRSAKGTAAFAERKATMNSNLLCTQSGDESPHSKFFGKLADSLGRSYCHPLDHRTGPICGSTEGTCIMPYAASCSRIDDSLRALDEVCQKISAELGGATPDLSFLFVSREHAANFDELSAAAHKRTGSRHILGCTGESIAAGGHELEEGPAFSMWSAVLPGAKLETFHVEFEATPDGPICSGLPEADSGPGGDTARAVLLVADPYSCAVDKII